MEFNGTKMKRFQLRSSVQSEIREALEQSIQKQSLNPEILKQYQFSRTEYLAQMTAHILKAFGDSMKILLSKGENPLVLGEPQSDEKPAGEEQ